MSDFQNTTMFTYDRLSNFVKGYKDYVDELITKAEMGDIFKYNHYEYSPNGITISDIGRIPSTALSALPNWKVFLTTNTPNAWKMNLSKTYNDIKAEEKKTLDTITKQSGLQYKVVLLPNSAYSTNSNTFFANANSLVNLFSQAGVTIVQSGIASSLDNYASAFQDPTSQIPVKVLNSNAVAFGAEWTGYFSPSKLGNYVFSISVGNAGGYFLMWIGNKVICEYTTFNIDAYNGKATFTMNAMQPGYYPIRIQYFNAMTPNTTALNFSLTVQKQQADGSVVNVPTSSCFYVIDNGNYVPKLLYCSFVSQSPTHFKSGKFQCYSYDLNASTSDFATLYALFNQYKVGMQSQQYDSEGNLVEFGQLPDNTNYTPVAGDVNSLPDRFSIYRLDSDLRMGKTFQIDTRANGETLYEMRMINPTPNAPNKPILSYAEDYHEMPNYYPNTSPSDLSVFQTATDLNGEACKMSCNSSQNCNHYFTYTSRGNPKCIIDTENVVPSFNQIQPDVGLVNPIDTGSSSLFMRNLQFVEPTCNGVSSDGKPAGPIAQVKTVNNVNVYNNSVFPYNDFVWDSEAVNAVDDIGVCGDKRFRKMTNDAAQILFQNATYKPDGSWTNGQGQSENASTAVNEQWGAWKQTEGFQNVGPTVIQPPAQSKYTDAISDTADSIHATLQNEQQYAQLMDHVNQNYLELSQTRIPEYLRLRKQLNGNVNADYNGNTLLYLRNKPVPTVQERNISDIQEQYNTQNLVYILGTITAASLLVLALIIGRD
jgi:hypothetical protein